MLFGCNWWAGYAGVNMWRDWRPEAIAKELDALKDVGVGKLRLFPCWRDFQPLEFARTVMNWPRELRLHGKRLPETKPGCYGVDEVMLDRFGAVLDMAHERGMKVNVGLITGWMSGEMLVPHAFADRDLMTDPLVVRWELALIKAIVGRFKTHPAIDSWGPGNETNCIQAIKNRQAAAAWMHTIANAIRSEDDTHPIVSGMHSLVPKSIYRVDVDNEGPVWTIQDNAEAFDVLTVHPYPLFTPYCNLSRLDEFRNLFHAACQMSYYSGIGNRPCIVEEIGAFSKMMAGEKVKYDYLKGILWNTWAHGCREFLWWCGADHTFVYTSPYDWSACERELGLLDENGKPLPFAAAVGEFNAVVKSLPTALPDAEYDAVCILSEDQDEWANAFGCFLLAEQAGLRLRFAWHGDSIPECKLYIVPGLAGTNCIEHPEYDLLLERAREGARVIFTSSNGVLCPSDKYFGFEPHYLVMNKPGMATVKSTAKECDFEFQCRRKGYFEIAPGTANVLAEADGQPALFENKYGKGSLVFFTMPIEEYAATSQDEINTPDKYCAYKVYQMLAKGYIKARVATANTPKCSVSYHPLDDTHGYVFAVNNSLETMEKPVALSDGWQIDTIYHGDIASLPPHEALIMSVRR